jgi:hypothetical protein
VPHQVQVTFSMASTRCALYLKAESPDETTLVSVEVARNTRSVTAKHPGHRTIEAIKARLFCVVGTRSCAIRHRTSEEGEHLVKLIGKSLSSDSARARSQKQQKEAGRHAGPCSAGRAGAHPYRRSGSVLSFLRCIPTIQF